MEVVIETCGLTKQFGRITAVDGLNLEVRRGDVFGFLGPNGAGKSTTIRMILGLIRPTSGTAKLFGRDVARDVDALRSVGAMVETPAFYKYLSGRQNLHMLAGKPPKKADMDAVLEEVGIASRAEDKVKTYSQGMRQRLGLALAMLNSPELVILDEPTNGLDPQGMREIRGIVRSLARDRGVTIFLSSHLLHEVEQTCDRVGIVSKGTLIAEGKVAELMSASNEAKVSVDRLEDAVKFAATLDYVQSTRTAEQSLYVSLADGKAADLNAALVQHGFRVSELAPQCRSLEEIYLSIFDGVAEEAAEDATGNQA